jgi:hypothetical protein
LFESVIYVYGVSPSTITFWTMFESVIPVSGVPPSTITRWTMFESVIHVYGVPPSTITLFPEGGGCCNWSCSMLRMV